MTALLTITRGLAGSGKTTWARSQDGAVLVGRDHIRRMLGPVPWPHGDQVRERIVTVAQHALIRALLAEDLHVIVDDTALRAADAQRLAAVAMSVGLGVPVKVQDFTHVSVETCISQDSTRPEGERVGAEKIREMAARWLTPDC